MRASVACALLLVLLSACVARPQHPAENQEVLLRRVLDEFKDSPGFTVEPVGDLFVVASNAGPRRTAFCKSLVRRVPRILMKTYFEKRPELPIAIYLLGDRRSYEAYRDRCVGSPDTPFGFFVPYERKLVMNIATGTGTLVHELVHPFIAEDFPEVPAWLNEGLASLYEGYQLEGEMIRGLVNWRLPYVQEAIAKGELIPLAELLEMSDGRFYRLYALPYAEARYLCMYLQEQGRLVAFYKAFRKHAAAGTDARGATTLQAVTGKPLDALEREWVAWVRTLRWRR